MATDRWDRKGAVTDFLGFNPSVVNQDCTSGRKTTHYLARIYSLVLPTSKEHLSAH